MNLIEDEKIEMVEKFIESFPEEMLPKYCTKEKLGNILLFYLGGESVKDIAEGWNYTEKSVRSILKKFISFLTKTIEKNKDAYLLYTPTALEDLKHMTQKTPVCP